MRTIANVFFILGIFYTTYNFYSVTKPWKNIDNEEIKIAYNYLKRKDRTINTVEFMLLIILAYIPLAYIKNNNIINLSFYKVIAFDILISIAIQWIVSSYRSYIYQEGLHMAYFYIKSKDK